MNCTFKEKKVENEEELYEIAAFIEDLKVGQLIYRKRERIRIYSIEVSPEMRRKEIGSRLVHHLAMQSKAVGCNMVEVMLENAAETKQKFFESNGFDLSYFLWRCGLAPVFEEENRIHYCLHLDQSPAEGVSSLRELQEWILSLSPENEDEEKKDDNTDNQNNLLDTNIDNEDEYDMEERFSQFAAPIEMEPMTNADLICGNCIYRTSDRNVMTCHKYADKPYEVITDDECEFFIG